ncbi:acyl carrier protein [Streptomyces sp. NPDC088785]|uniref:acyl carrier protein n=1 Tax=Streptomyces sp. NPDC088785 TaxID=3365897 RepID=UPI00381BD03F
MNTDAVTGRLLDFIRTEFLWSDDGVTIDATTPLLEWGIVDSLRIALLQAFILNEWDVSVPAARIDAKNFKNAGSIAAMICELDKETV